jgi:peptide/nickel transport system substrate-binding protein
VRKTFSAAIVLLVGISLLLTSCGSPKATTTTPPATTATTPTTTKTAAPTTTATPPTTVSQSTPKYGGYYLTGMMDPLGFDEGMVVRANAASTQTTQYLIGADWTKGPSGTGKSDFVYGFIGDMSLETGFLAESWDMPDGQTIVFHIRRGCNFFINPDSAATKLVNGREFNADDAVFNLNRVFFEAKASDKYTIAADQKPLSIKATDKYTVEIKVNPVYQGLMLTQCGSGTFMYAPEVIKQYGNINDWKNACGTGPFMLKDYVTGSSMTYVRNPNYWKKDPYGPGKGNQLPYVDGVRGINIPDLSTQIAAFTTGKLDRMTNMTLEDKTMIAKTRPDVIINKRIAPPFVISGRVDKNLPFNDIRVRQALNMATDKADILKSLFQGQGYMLGYPYSNAPCHSEYYTPLEQQPQAVKDLFTYNPDKAKKLLADAGFPNGFKTQILCQATVFRGVVGPDFLSIIKQMWAKVGVDVEIKPVESTVFQSMRRGRTFDQMIFDDGKGYGWPYQFNMFRLESFDDVAQWETPVVRDYYNKIQAVLFKDPAAMNKLLKDFGPYVLEQAPGVWLPTADYYTLWQPWIKNYSGEDWLSYSHFDEYMQYLWTDQDAKHAKGY